MRVPSPSRRNLAVAAAVLALFLVVYGRTMLPCVGGYGDSSKFQFVGKIRGLPHPTGFPLYLAINRLVSQLPVGTLAARVSFISAACGAATLALVSLLVSLLTGWTLAGLLSAGLLGTIPLFWSSALIPEVYTLNTLLLSAALLFLAAWLRRPRRRFLYLSWAFFCAGLGNHPSLLAFLPAFAVAAWPGKGRPSLRRGDLLPMAAIAAAGAAQYLLIYAWSRGDPVYLEGRVDGLAGLVRYALGGRYTANYFPAPLGTILTVHLRLYLSVMRSQFGVAGAVLAAAGAVWLGRLHPRFLAALAALWAGQLFLSLPSVTVETPVYFVPSCLTAAVLAGCSVPLVAEIARNRGAAGRALLAVCACAAVALIAIPAARDWPGADLSRVRHYDEFTSKALEVIPAGGLLLSPNYQWTEAYLYKILGEGARGDDPVFILNNWEPGRVPEYRRGRGIDFLVYRPAAAPAPPLRILFHAQSSFDPRIARFRRAGERLEPLLFQESAALDALRKRAEGRLLLVSAKDEGMPVCNDAAYDFLLSLGLKPRSAGGMRWGWSTAAAVVPVRGAPRGIVVHRFGVARIRLAMGAPVGDSGIVSPASIEIESAPLGRGDRSRIRVDGRSVGGGDRGVNVAIVDPSTGEVEERLRYSCGDLSGMNDAAVYELIPEGAR
ncbi:MAG: DUF2723 domain-containing protein [Candidatus Aureabacteria bacterium]|nr:DUF2723 domain-containing protein [Candidatus Auribacterota bacterium]